MTHFFSIRLRQRYLLVCLPVILAALYFFYIRNDTEIAAPTMLDAEQMQPLPDTLTLADSVKLPPHKIRAVEKTPTELLQQERYDEPLQELIPTDEESRLLYEAEEAALTNCMNERGFEYIPNPYLSNKELYAVDAFFASSENITGYGISDSLSHYPIPLPVSANDVLTDHLSSEEQNAWANAFSGQIPTPENPIPSGSIVSVEIPSLGIVAWDQNSCLATARRAVYGDDVKHMQDRIAEDVLRRQITSTIDNDPGYKRSLQHWRNCMQAHQLQFEYPRQAAEILSGEYAAGTIDLDTLRQRETAIASTDRACYQQAEIDTAYRSATKQAETQVRQLHSEEITALHAALVNALKQAENYRQ